MRSLVTDVDGVRHRERRCVTFEAATAWLHDIETEIEAGTWSPTNEPKP